MPSNGGEGQNGCHHIYPTNQEFGCSWKAKCYDNFFCEQIDCVHIFHFLVL